MGAECVCVCVCVCVCATLASMSQAGLVELPWHRRLKARLATAHQTVSIGSRPSLSNVLMRCAHATWLPFSLTMILQWPEWLRSTLREELACYGAAGPERSIESRF
jgi:hypothetical protein